MASVGDVIAIANLVLKAIDACKTAYGSAKEKTELCDRLRTLPPILKYLDPYIRSDAPEALRETFQSLLEDLRKYLNNLKLQLERKDNMIKEFMAKTQWVKEKDEVKEKFEKIDGLVQQLNLGLMVESRVDEMVKARGMCISFTSCLLMRSLFLFPLSSFGVSKFTLASKTNLVLEEELLHKFRTELQKKFTEPLEKTPHDVQSITEGTGEWFWEEEVVREWMSSEGELLCVFGSRMFLCSFKFAQHKTNEIAAGAGKTGLA